MTPNAEIVRTGEAARIVGVNVGTLRYWRVTNYGPPWFRLGPRLVAYLRSDLETWLRDQIDSTYVNPEKAQ
jgi:predicted DNA-binding transcriptional regulator AlpA